MTDRDWQDGIDESKDMDAATVGPRLRAHERVAGDPGPECLDDHRIAALADGTIAAAEREAAVLHLARCARCRRAVASVARALHDPELRRDIAAAVRGRSRHWYTTVPLAAAAVLLLMLWPRTTSLDRAASVHRGPAAETGQVLLTRSPSGLVAAAKTFTWTAVRGADRYRFVLFDAQGRVVEETQVTDTTLTLADSVAIAAGRTYAWKVHARTGWDRWIESALTEFTVRTPER